MAPVLQLTGLTSNLQIFNRHLKLMDKVSTLLKQQRGYLGGRSNRCRFQEGYDTSICSKPLDLDRIRVGGYVQIAAPKMISRRLVNPLRFSASIIPK